MSHFFSFLFLPPSLLDCDVLYLKISYFASCDLKILSMEKENNYFELALFVAYT